jgi:hypothetical protein
MKILRAAKAALVAGAIAASLLGGTLAVAEYMQKKSAHESSLSSTNSP